MSGRSLHELLHHQDWYTVMYGLAAHRSHAAAAGGEDAERDLERAQSEALLLALACVSAVRAEGRNDRWPKALDELERELFGLDDEAEPRPRADAAPRRRMVPEMYLIRNPSKRALTPPDQGVPRSKLLAFLEETVEPSALVLLAGITAELRGEAEPAQDDEAFDRQAIEKMLVAAVEHRGALNPRRLADGVAARKDLDGRTHYNLACFYAQASGLEHGDDAQATLEQARRHLKTALATIARSARADLARWARRDPSLRRAIAGWDQAETVLGPDAGAPTAPEPRGSMLSQLAAIGGYAKRLEKLDVQTPARLRAAMADERRRVRLAVALRVDDSMLERWSDLLELLALEGVGPTDVNLLDVSGISRVDQLAESDARRLYLHVARANVAYGYAARTPSVEEIELWIDEARRRRRPA
jgi:hypothetical protein